MMVAMLDLQLVCQPTKSAVISKRSR